MPEWQPKTRLFVSDDLGPDMSVVLSADQAHQIVSVLRLGPGAAIELFNGRDGGWAAELSEATRKRTVAACRDRVRDQVPVPDVWLCFAPLKKARTDFVAEKAAEMGCRRLIPVMTRYTNTTRVNTGRLRAHGIEAAEQCGLTSVPEVAEPVALDTLLRAWPEDRQVLFCDESGAGMAASASLGAAAPGPWAILIGPEGGFSPEERQRLAALSQAVPVSLGPRILRADTAAVAALALWQAALGDWR